MLADLCLHVLNIYKGDVSGQWIRVIKYILDELSL